MNIDKKILQLSLLNKAFNIPCFVYKDNALFCSFSNELLKEAPYISKKELLKSDKSPNYFISIATNAQYGYLKLDDEYKLIIGPILSTPVTLDDIAKLSNECEVKNNDDFKSYINSLNKYPFPNFLSLLAYLSFSINNEEINIEEHFSFNNEEINEDVANKASSEQVKQEISVTHGTYFFEKQMLDYVKEGNIDRLKKFLFDAIGKMKINEGKVAETPLRQSKNIFIGLVNAVGKFAAVPAGLPIEETYFLIDTYTQQCERLNDIQAINILRFNMLIDFTNRIHQITITNNVSKDVELIIDYIDNHIQEKILICNIADGINRSKTYITNKFKDEVGLTINEYILKRKLTISKNLLRHTDMTLMDISEYFSFSSQAYYQNCFKKEFGITPSNYRKQKRQNIN